MRRLRAYDLRGVVSGDVPPATRIGRRRRTAALTGVSGVVIVACLGLAACSDGGEAEGTEWTEPAWFAEQAREREEIATILQECMDAKGWDVQVDEYGGIDANLAPFPDDGAQLVADMTACYDQIPSTYKVTVDAAYYHDVLYPQQVDVYHCLVNQGIDVSAPPPVDIWVEDMLADKPDPDLWIAWNDGWVAPYLDDGTHGYDDLVQLEVVCPQPYIAP